MSRFESPLPPKQVALDKVIEAMILAFAFGVIGAFAFAILEAFKAQR